MNIKMKFAEINRISMIVDLIEENKAKVCDFNWGSDVAINDIVEVKNLGNYVEYVKTIKKKTDTFLLSYSGGKTIQTQIINYFQKHNVVCKFLNQSKLLIAYPIELEKSLENIIKKAPSIIW